MRRFGTLKNFPKKRLTKKIPLRISQNLKNEILKQISQEFQGSSLGALHSSEIVGLTSGKSGRATTVGGRYVGRVHFDFSSILVRH